MRKKINPTPITTWLATIVLLASTALAASDDEGFLGIIMKPLPDQTVQVTGLASGASAQKAGVQEGDILLKFQGKEIHSPEQLTNAVKATKPGTTASLLVRRNGKDKTFELLIVSRQAFLGGEIESWKGKKVPSLVGIDVRSGKESSITKYSGKPFILELWATWCPACRNNMPKLDGIAKNMRGRIGVVGVSFEDRDTVKKFLSNHEVAYDLLVVDPSNVNTSYLSNTSIPKYIIVDAKGIVVDIRQNVDEAEDVVDGLKLQP